MAGDVGDLAGILESLVGRIARGELRAEDEFMARYQVTARAIAQRHCRRFEAQVDDIVQDVLTAMLRKLRAGAIENPIALPHYLQQALKNACLAFYQQQNQERREDVSALDATPAPRSDPVDLMEYQQRQRMVRALVEELPQPRDREILRRFYIHEESRDDICRALDIDEHHFRRVMSRARQRLRDVVGERRGQL